MKFIVSILVSLLISIPVAGQELAQVLLDLGCTTACVCHPEKGCPSKVCGVFNPSIPIDVQRGVIDWNRYGFDERPLHIGDGTHSALQTEAENILLEDFLPRLTANDKFDLNKVWCGNQSARARIVSLKEPTPSPEPVVEDCYPSWKCTELPQELVTACKSREKGYNCRDVRFRSSDRFGCWKLGTPTHLGVTVYFNESDPRCNPFLKESETDPNPICGNSVLEEGETCESCPADQMESCEPC